MDIHSLSGCEGRSRTHTLWPCAPGQVPDEAHLEPGQTEPVHGEEEGSWEEELD